MLLCSQVCYGAGKKGNQTFQWGTAPAGADVDEPFCDKVGTEGSLRATWYGQKRESQSEEALDKGSICILAFRILNPNIRISRASAVNRHIGLGN